jgi:pimeloyl-ACP methyl ester carboxylesterase
MPEFNSGGVRIHYELAGPDEGPPALLLHGYASDYELNWVGSRWQETLAAAGRLVVGPDLRGHGSSDKPHDPAAYEQSLLVADAVNLLEHLDLEPADCIGYSMGAHLALRILVDHPGRLRRAVLGGLRTSGGAQRAQAIAARMRGDASVTDPVAVTFHRFASARPINDLEALAACITGWQPRLQEEELRRVEAPVLLVLAESDRQEEGDTWPLLQLPDARLVVLHGRDHLNAVTSRQFKEEALAFLKEPQ